MDAEAMCKLLEELPAVKRHVMTRENTSSQLQIQPSCSRLNQSQDGVCSGGSSKECSQEACANLKKSSRVSPADASGAGTVAAGESISSERVRRTRAYLDEVLMDLMARYGAVSELSEPNDHSITAALGVTSGPAAGAPANGGSGYGSDGPTVHLRLHLFEARGVEGMDLFSGADLFCVSFIGGLSDGAHTTLGLGWPQGVGLETAKGNRLFQTKIVKAAKVAKETDESHEGSLWCWNEVRVDSNFHPPGNIVKQHQQRTGLLGSYRRTILMFEG